MISAAAIIVTIAAFSFFAPAASAFTLRGQNELPMPFKWPIVGTLPDFFARGGVDNFNHVHESMYADYGNVYGMSMMGDDELIICDPNVYDKVLRREGRFPIGGSEAVTTFPEYYRENNLTFALKSFSR